MHKHATEQRVVYFIRAEGLGLVKIGVANCIHGRLRQMGQLLPFEVTVLGVLPCSRDSILEQMMHGRFKHLRQRGEWFREAPELLEYIDTHAQPAPPKRRLSAQERRAKNAKRREQYRARVERGVQKSSASAASRM